MIIDQFHGEAARKKLALVLGGGGGKGGAHLGVLGQLELLGLPIDMFIGTSIGGVVAALYAAGYSIGEIANNFTSTSLWRLMDPDPLGLGLLGMSHFRSSVEDMLGELTFEELKYPCAVVAGDLVTGQEVVIDSGPIVDALMASVALPGIFPPVRRGDMLLADGGVVNNVPVDVAYARGADKVIAVDLGGMQGGFQLPPTTVSLLPNVPLTIANRGLGVLIAQLTRCRLEQHPPDVLICPQVDHIGMLDFVRVNEGQAAGEAATQAVADQLLEIYAWRTDGAPLPQLALPSFSEAV
ncbi:patatin [Chloroflexia bacterium SDU3-3]|nr:patatin [Chloroflexia bacterium SDU3-3]